MISVFVWSPVVFKVWVQGQRAEPFELTVFLTPCLSLTLRIGLGLKKVHREKKKTMSEKAQKTKEAGMTEGAGMLKEEREFM